MYPSIAPVVLRFFFFFNDTATTEIYTLSLHDALPIYARDGWVATPAPPPSRRPRCSPLRRRPAPRGRARRRSEEHTSELQSLAYLVCRLLLEKKKRKECPRRRARGPDPITGRGTCLAP